MRRRIARWVTGWGTAMLTGAFFVLGFAALDKNYDPSRVPEPLVLGAFYGLGVLALLRLLRVRGWGLAVAGLVCGPVPIVLLIVPEMAPGDERGGLVLVGLLGGLFIGLMEWARASSRAAREGAREERD